jgi:hypothetical protein
LLWYNKHTEVLLSQAFRLRRTVRAHGSAVDGFAKIPLQASIFASWYNKHSEVLLRKPFGFPLLPMRA